MAEPLKRRERGGVHSSIWLGFVPWVLFAILCRRDSLQAAVVVGLVGAVLVSLSSILAGHPKLLELGTIVFFVAFVIVVFAVDPGADDFLNRYGRAIATGGLALIAAVSLLLGKPFTLWKFRTMSSGAEAKGPLLAADALAAS